MLRYICKQKRKSVHRPDAHVYNMVWIVQYQYTLKITTNKIINVLAEYECIGNLLCGVHWPIRLLLNIVFLYWIKTNLRWTRLQVIAGGWLLSSICLQGTQIPPYAWLVKSLDPFFGTFPRWGWWWYVCNASTIFMIAQLMLNRFGRSPKSLLSSWAKDLSRN